MSIKYLTLLNSRPYISPSRERRLTGIAPASMDEDDQRYIEGNKEPAKATADEGSVSLFHLRMPGILSEEEVIHRLEELGDWAVLCGDQGYKLKVRDLASFV